MYLKIYYKQVVIIDTHNHKVNFYVKNLFFNLSFILNNLYKKTTIGKYILISIEMTINETFFPHLTKSKNA